MRHGGLSDERTSEMVALNYVFAALQVDSLKIKYFTHFRAVKVFLKKAGGVLAVVLSAHRF